MTKKLESLFGLNDDDSDSLTSDIVQSDDIDNAKINNELINEETLKTIEKVENALPLVRGLDATDRDLDEFSDLAKEAFNNLLDLGMQVDSRFSAEIFNSASSMLGHAIGAKTAKINKKLRMIDLQLKKAELERKISVQNAKQESTDVEDSNLGIGTVIDRNDLIRQVLAQVENNKNVKKDK
jgi:hypothetical protein